MSLEVVVYLPDAIKELGALATQVPFAAAKALTAVAFDVRDAERIEVTTTFGSPRPYVVNATTVTRATKTDLTAFVRLKDADGKGNSPATLLQHHIEGGASRYTRFEKALYRAGVLPPGFHVAVPSGGNALTGGQITRLMSYLQLHPEVGAKANMTAKGIARTEKRGRAGAFATINGVAYFVSHGPEIRVGRRSWRDGRDNRQLARGIWAKSGIHGAEVKPVALFIREPSHRRRLDYIDVARQTIERQWPERFTAALELAIRTAK